MSHTGVLALVIAAATTQEFMVNPYVKRQCMHLSMLSTEHKAYIHLFEKHYFNKYNVFITYSMLSPTLCLVSLLYKRDYI